MSSKQCIIGDINKVISGIENSMPEKSFIKKDYNLVIVNKDKFSSVKKAEGISTMIQERLNTKFNSNIFGQIAIKTSPYSFKIKVPEKLVDAYDVKFGNLELKDYEKKYNSNLNNYTVGKGSKDSDIDKKYDLENNKTNSIKILNNIINFKKRKANGYF